MTKRALNRDPMLALGLSFLLCLLCAVPALAGDLPDRVDPALQADLEGTLESLGLGERAAAGDLAVALADVSDVDKPRLAMVNGHHMIYAASLPKIAILLGAAVALDAGELVMTPSLEKDLHEMCPVSRTAQRRTKRCVSTTCCTGANSSAASSPR